VTEVREARALCPECHASVAADFVACPSCGHRVGGACPHCHKSIQPGWKFCPYCANTTEAAPRKRSPRQLRHRKEVRELPTPSVLGSKTS
jgi:hypothetical protein